MPGPIVVGIGGDGSGARAARTAARVAEMMGAPVVLVFGFESSPLAPRFGSIEEQIAAVGREAIDQVRDDLLAEFPSLTVEVELVPDRPVDSLVRVAEARGAEAIAVGHGGEGPIRGTLLGSTTYEIVHRAPFPVLVVPDDPDED